MGRRKKTRSVVIFGRRWWQRSAGNTYCSVVIYVNGEFVHRIHTVQGGGEYWQQMAETWLIENGYFPGVKRHTNGSYPPLCEGHGLQLIAECADVAREGDL